MEREGLAGASKGEPGNSIDLELMLLDRVNSSVSATFDHWCGILDLTTARCTVRECLQGKRGTALEWESLEH